MSTQAGGRINNNSVTTTKIADKAVTLGKEADGTANSLQGYDNSGVATVVTAGSNVTISSNVISAAGGDNRFPTAFTYIGLFSTTGGIMVSPQVTTAYNELWITIDGIAAVAGSGLFNLQGSTDNGSTWKNGASDNTYFTNGSNAATATSVIMSTDTTANLTWSGCIRIKNNYVAAATPTVTWTLYSSGGRFYTGWGKLLTAGQYDKFRVFNSGTTMAASGNSRIYGVTY